MGNRNCRSAPGNIVQGFLDHLLCSRVQSTGGLVKKQNTGIGNYASGDGNALFLASTQGPGSLADKGIIALYHVNQKHNIGFCNAYLRLLKNEIVGVASLTCFLYQLELFFMREIILLVYQSFGNILKDCPSK